MLDIHHRASDRREDPRGARYHDGGDVKAPGNLGCMHRSTATEADEVIVARILPALDRRLTDGRGHVFVRDLQDTFRRLEDVHSQPPGEVFDRLRRSLLVERALAAQKGLRIEPPEYEVGVGDRGLSAALPIADRPRIGTRTLGADPQ